MRQNEVTKKIVYTATQKTAEGVVGSYMNVFGTMEISKSYITQVKDAVKSYCSTLGDSKEVDALLQKVAQKNNFKHVQNMYSSCFRYICKKHNHNKLI